MSQQEILFPHGELSGNEVMTGYLEDNRRRLKRALADVDELGLHWQPDLERNCIAVTLWHMGRLMDHFLTCFVKGEAVENEQWFSQGWVERTGYDPRGHGRDGWGTVNDYTPEEVAAIPRLTKAQLLAHLDQVYDEFKAYIDAAPMKELTGAAPGFCGQYTKNQVLSMVLLDNVRHLGEIYLLKAMYPQ